LRPRDADRDETRAAMLIASVCFPNKRLFSFLDRSTYAKVRDTRSSLLAPIFAADDESRERAAEFILASLPLQVAI
jgi:hypothetical protein